MATRKMRLNAAKQERRNANNGESRSVSRPTCTSCGGKTIATAALVNISGDDVEVVAAADICRAPDKSEMH